MGLTVTAQVGRTPHPSIALIERDWAAAELNVEKLAYLRVKSGNDDLGVLRVLDSGIRSQDELFLDPKAWLAHVPEAGTKIQLEAADETNFTS